MECRVNLKHTTQKLSTFLKPPQQMTWTTVKHIVVNFHPQKSKMFCYQKASKGGQEKRKHRKQYYNANTNADQKLLGAYLVPNNILEGFMYLLQFLKPYMVNVIPTAAFSTEIYLYSLYFRFQMSELMMAWVY